MMSRSDWANQPNHIRRFRKQRNLRLRDVARLLGLRESCHIGDWETGRRAPTIQNALKLSAALDCPVEVLFSNHFREFRHEINQRRQKLREMRTNH